MINNRGVVLVASLETGYEHKMRLLRPGIVVCKVKVKVVF